MTKGIRNIILFDDDNWSNFLPLSFTRPISEFRVGILTIREKWERYLQASVSHITQEYLSEKFPIVIEDHNYIINGGVLPDEKLAVLIQQLDHNEALLFNDTLIAAHLDRDQFDNLMEKDTLDEIAGISIEEEDFKQIQNIPDLFRFNAEELAKDFELITNGRQSQGVDRSVLVRGSDIFIEEGAVVENCILNSTTGPIYIGKDAHVMDGAMVRGGLALCENSVLKMGAKIYGATTIGPFSKVGGEVNNSIFQGYSNKAHDGFLGNSVIGEWCNLGADSNNSNLKNNYTSVKLWNYNSESFVDTGLQFCGLIMGDHSKCGINTMFNTGTMARGFLATLFLRFPGEANKAL
jgi:UDP-N-acetylglucosamine diphosphorylase/glucosamine-1-phosphate N-acetyltransferase